MYVTGLRVRNLRCLHDTKTVAIKPFTVLVGRNSSGKSTFARVLPLVRQSIEESTRGPVLWYGNLVDFGGFSAAMSRGASSRMIMFGIDFVLDPIEAANRARGFRYEDSLFAGFPAPPLLNKQLDGTIDLYLCEDDEGTYAARVMIKAFGNECEVSFKNARSVENVAINKDTYWTSEDDSRAVVRQIGFLPTIDFYRKARIRTGADSKPVVWRRDNPLIQPLIRQVGSMVHGNTSSQQISRIAKRLALAEDSDLLAQMRALASAPSSWRERVNRMTTKMHSFRKLRNALFASRLPLLLEVIDDAVSNFFSSVRYVDPLRATAQRYYRHQELAIDEIDAKGTNVAMYLSSLSASGEDDFRRWMIAHFGVSIQAKKEGGHVALTLQQEKSRDEINLADMGFGFSQVLPIAIQLWAAARGRRAGPYGRREGATSTIVIEQPELHLHPQLQAKLADIVVAAIKNARENNVALKVILETHSPHLISRLGELISVKEFDEKLASVVLFNQEEKNKTAVSTSSFDGEGILCNWPFGFFEPDL